MVESLQIKKYFFTNKARNTLSLILFTLPALILIFILVAIPFLMDIFYSFTLWSGISNKVKFIGLKNFIDIFTNDPRTITALLFTIKFTIFFVIVSNVIALFIAYFLDDKLKTKNFLRTIFFIPNVLSLIVMGFMWRFIFTRGFDALYKFTNLPIFDYGWLSDANLAMISILIVSIWQTVGYIMIIYIAGLQTISQSLIESAKIDGANELAIFFKIKIPCIMPAITTCVFYTLTWGLKVFDTILALTNGGPGYSTTSTTIDIYRECFINNRYGYGTAKAVLFFIIIFIITVIQVLIFKKKESDL